MLEFIGSGFELYLRKDGQSYVSRGSCSTYGLLTFIPGSILVSLIFKLDPFGTEGLLYPHSVTGSCPLGSGSCSSYLSKTLSNNCPLVSLDGIRSPLPLNCVQCF